MMKPDAITLVDLPAVSRREPRAFTLVELLVVVAIMGVLIGLAFPAVQKSLQQAKTVKCLTNLKGIGMGLQQYIDAVGNQRMPSLVNRLARTDPGPAIDTLLLEVGDVPEEIFDCPSDKADWFATAGTSYHWNEDLNNQHLTQLNTFGVDDTTKVVVLADRESFHPELPLTVNLLFADYHVDDDLFDTSDPPDLPEDIDD